MAAGTGEDQHRISPDTLAKYPYFVNALLSVKKAAAKANHVAGTATQEKTEALVSACEHLRTQHLLFDADPYSGGGGILINLQANRLIAHRAGVETADANASQSTADVLASAMRVALIQAGQPLLIELGQTIRLMELNQKKFSETMSTARTCLQDAMPVTLGTLFEGYAQVLSRRTQAIASALKGLHQINLGGTVIGSGEGATASYKNSVVGELKTATGLELELRPSLYDAAQNADDIGELTHALALLAEVSIKIGKDLRLLHSGPEQGFNEIRLPQIIPGSSFFKSKNNPTIPETFLQGCFLILGRCRTAGLTLEHAELNLNVFETAGAFAIYEALELSSKSFRILNSNCLQSISASPAKSKTKSKAKEN